jgi:HAD superfamily hydrolase (TIGR01490 family)
MTKTHLDVEPRADPVPASGATPPAIAFFDLDRTLLGCNSAVPWLLDEVRRGHLGLLGALRAIAALARYRLGDGGVESALVWNVSRSAGRDARETERYMSGWYERVLRGRMRPGGLAALRDHRARGERCVLLTSGTQHLSAIVARDLGLDDVVCTVAEIDGSGRFTGRVVGRPCFGPGKAMAAERHAAAAAVPLSRCTFYTDAAADLPTLEVVGHPVVVNPDPRLGRIARARGWPVVDWGTPVRPRVRPS